MDQESPRQLATRLLIQAHAALKEAGQPFINPDDLALCLALFGAMRAEQPHQPSGNMMMAAAQAALLRR